MHPRHQHHATAWYTVVYRVGGVHSELACPLILTDLDDSAVRSSVAIPIAPHPAFE